MPDNMLGKINRQLSEENSKLMGQNERLEVENQRLRLQLAEVGDGRVIPISKMNHINHIATLRTRIKILENKLSKYEPVSITEKYGESQKVTDYIERTYKSSTSNSEETVSKSETDVYRPQETVQIKNALVRKSSKMHSGDIFKLIEDYLINNNKSTKVDIMNNTNLTYNQASKTLRKYSDRLIIDTDPNNRRRYLYSLK